MYGSAMESEFETAGGYVAPPSGGQLGAPAGSPAEAALAFVRDYSRDRPEVVAMWAFGIGFVLAWKLKPW